MMKGAIISAAMIVLSGCSASDAAEPNDRACKDLVLSVSNDLAWPMSTREYEIGDRRYSELAQLARCKPEMKPAIAKAYADGKVTYAEYDELTIQEYEHYNDAEQAKAKLALSAALK